MKFNVSVVVALRKESVDRNVNLRVVDGSKSSSLSARRAWIEMPDSLVPFVPLLVALRKESVDRNIISRCSLVLAFTVALRKESVDRNLQMSEQISVKQSSLSARRAWIEICYMIHRP